MHVRLRSTDPLLHRTDREYAVCFHARWVHYLQQIVIVKVNVKCNCGPCGARLVIWPAQSNACLAEGDSLDKWQVLLCDDLISL
jgi:hypothetical protein